MQRVVIVALYLICAMSGAATQTRPQQSPDGATGTKSNQEQGESKAIRQGTDVERGPGLTGDNTSETEAIRRSSTANVSLTPEQREKIKAYFARSSSPREENVNLSISVGASVPRQAPVHDFPEELERSVPAYRGTLYVRARDQLVIIDKDTRRIVAIIPNID
jgi:Protein of unknown function (DUF1236)